MGDCEPYLFAADMWAAALWRAPPTGAEMVCDDSCYRRCFVPDSENKRQLECLRLASERTQLAKSTPNADLKARFLRMAEVWSDHANQGHSEDAVVLRSLN